MFILSYLSFMISTFKLFWEPVFIYLIHNTYTHCIGYILYLDHVFKTAFLVLLLILAVLCASDICTWVMKKTSYCIFLWWTREIWVYSSDDVHFSCDMIPSKSMDSQAHCLSSSSSKKRNTSTSCERVLLQYQLDNYPGWIFYKIYTWQCVVQVSQTASLLLHQLGYGNHLDQDQN